MEETTLLTKVLLPRRRDDILSRPRLLNRLYDMIDYRLILVSAPAGYGKTTLLVDFATDLEHPVCWYALDASDRDPSVFLERLVMSMRRRFPNFGQQTLRALEATADLRGGAPGVVRVLVNEIITTIPRWFVLVLDDYHLLGRAPEVDAIVSNFVAFGRDQCLTVITSRSVPTLPLIIPLVARGGVGGLGQDDLRFTLEEIQRLFRHNYGIELSKADAQALAEQSEGWITGLLLTAYSRWEDVLQSWMRARDTNEPIYDYLAQEVFTRQPHDMQKFLLESSTLTEMSVRRCQEILGVPEAEVMLERVEAENLFVTRLENDWYRYHHLFREFLQKRLKTQAHDRWEILHRKAAEWLETHNQQFDAVQHYLAIGAHQEAARLMETTAENLYIRNRLSTLRTWRQLLGDVNLETAPKLALYQSRAAYKLGEREDALELAEIAERGYELQDDEYGVIQARVQRCEIWLVQGLLEDARALAQQTLPLAEICPTPVAYEIHRILGRTHVMLGDLEQGLKHLRVALELGDRYAHDYTRALIRTGLAQCLGALGRLHEAVAMHREALTIWRKLGSDAGLADELNDLGFHLYTLGEFTEALASVQEALTIARQTGLRQVEAIALVNLAELTRDLGFLEAAEHHGNEGRALALEIKDRYLAAYAQEALGLIYRRQQRWQQAHARLAQALQEAQALNAQSLVGRIHASLGVVLAESGAPAAGLIELDKAINLLSELGAQADLGRARLLRAWAHFLEGATQEPQERGASSNAIAELGQLLDTLPSPIEVQVFILEGQHLQPLLKTARKAYRNLPNRLQRLKRIERRIRALDDTAAHLFSQVSPPKQSEPPSIRIYGFGPGTVEVANKPVPLSTWGSASARHLLFYMLLYPNRTREQILDAFWPSLSPQKAKASFHTTKFRLKRALDREVIEFDGQRYTLNPDLKAWFDVAHFRELLEQWRRNETLEALQEAVSLYTDDLLTDCYLDWCQQEREALRLEFVDALAQLAERYLTRRQYRRAIETLQRALSVDPTHETFHQQLMRAYALAGERSRALAQYERCKTILRTQIGVPPSRTTETLRAQIQAEQLFD